jgi:hypothetical protein
MPTNGDERITETFCTRNIWGVKTCYCATTLIVALFPTDGELIGFPPRQTIVTRSHWEVGEKIPKYAQIIGSLIF